jgi:hypothetical protein
MAVELPFLAVSPESQPTLSGTVNSVEGQRCGDSTSAWPGETGSHPSRPSGSLDTFVAAGWVDVVFNPTDLCLRALHSGVASPHQLLSTTRVSSEHQSLLSLVHLCPLRAEPSSTVSAPCEPAECALAEPLPKLEMKTLSGHPGGPEPLRGASSHRPGTQRSEKHLSTKSLRRILESRFPWKNDMSHHPRDTTVDTVIHVTSGGTMSLTLRHQSAAPSQTVLRSVPARRTTGTTGRLDRVTTNRVDYEALKEVNAEVYETLSVL